MYGRISQLTPPIWSYLPNRNVCCVSLWRALLCGGLSSLTCEIRDLVVSGNLQVDLSLMPAPPLVAGVRVMFTEAPFISYDVGVKVTPGLPPIRLDVVPGRACYSSSFQVNLCLCVGCSH